MWIGDRYDSDESVPPRYRRHAVECLCPTKPWQHDPLSSRGKDPQPTGFNYRKHRRKFPPEEISSPTEFFSTRASCKRPGIDSARWWHTRVGYQIFVRSFRDSDGDGTGDLAGLESRLSYLSDPDKGLGADLVWLMPILQSPSYHGYDVADYEAVDDEYGSASDLASLVQSAEKQDIRLIMDLVLNHSSDTHPWFLEDAMDDSRDSGEARYVWSPSALNWTQPWSSSNTWHPKAGRWFYGLFSPSMPDLNFGNATVRSELMDVASKWIESGLHGYRLDAVRYLVESGPESGQKDTEDTHAFWQELRGTLPAETLLVGEAWAELEIARTYFGGENLPGTPHAFRLRWRKRNVECCTDRKSGPSPGKPGARGGKRRPATARGAPSSPIMTRTGLEQL